MSGLRVGVVTFPGSLDDVDAQRAARVAGHQPVPLWHRDHDLQGVDAVVLPGGFSYGDYLRCGAISRFSPLMAEIVAGAGQGLPVLGICNGFQILCESHLLPGALVRNQERKFICRDQQLRIESTRTPWTSSFTQGQEIVVPLKNGEGCYVADDATLDELEGEGRVVARYLGRDPNGSMRGIAGVSNARGNVVGLMPHPEHAVEEGFGPGTDGLGFFTLVEALVS
ncbi:MAG: phosphoribosylformylglycinamidine synthase subunit PurQ / glutaminase [Nocardioidaceae bacterium]|nr:phosphoribosylformylglycinamidine synthase subunit PurQ / glutaminase [Nocardioidaceae bacterium]